MQELLSSNTCRWLINCWYDSNKLEKWVFEEDYSESPMDVGSWDIMRNFLVNQSLESEILGNHYFRKGHGKRQSLIGLFDRSEQYRTMKNELKIIPNVIINDVKALLNRTCRYYVKRISVLIT